jgi:hypothetical protein
MSGDEDFGHFLPVLRRIIILVAVITAIPVVLWTITAFVRIYVSPPKIPTFHQLAASASINGSSNPGAQDDANKKSSAATAEAPKNPTAAPATMEARATTTDVRGGNSAPKGPFLGDHPPDNAAPVATVSAGQPAMNAQTLTAPAVSAPAVSAPAVIASAAAAKMPDATPAAMPAAAPADTLMPSAVVAPPVADSAQASAAVSPQQPAATADASADNAPALPAAEPLSGPVPLPRVRPNIVTAAETTPAQTTRMAAVGPIPMPRPRPEAAGPSASADDSSGSPLGFIQNLFGGSK